MDGLYIFASIVEHVLIINAIVRSWLSQPWIHIWIVGVVKTTRCRIYNYVRTNPYAVCWRFALQSRSWYFVRAPTTRPGGVHSSSGTYHESSPFLLRIVCLLVVWADHLSCDGATGANYRVNEAVASILGIYLAHKGGFFNPLSTSTVLYCTRIATYYCKYYVLYCTFQRSTWNWTERTLSQYNKYSNTDPSEQIDTPKKMYLDGMGTLPSSIFRTVLSRLRELQ